MAHYGASGKNCQCVTSVKSALINSTDSLAIGIGVYVGIIVVHVHLYPAMMPCLTEYNRTAKLYSGKAILQSIQLLMVPPALASSA